MRMWLTDLDGAMRFFQLCQVLNLNTEEERQQLMEAMAKQNAVTDLGHATEEQFNDLVQELSKTLKIGFVTPKKEEEK